MNDKIQKALINRQERLESKNVLKTNDKISNALEKREKRIISNLDTTLIALQKDIDKEIQVYNNLQKLSFGYDTNIKALESTNSSRVQIGKLKNTVEAHRKYIGNDSADMLLSTLNEMSEGYNNYLSAAKQYSNFKSENDYNAYIMNNTADLEGGMNAESIAARVKAYEKTTARLDAIDNEIADMSDEEKWVEVLNPYSGSQMAMQTVNKPSEKHQELLDEKAYLEEQTRLYERYNKENDSLVSQFADSADFKVNSVYIPKESKNSDSGFYPDDYRTFLEYYSVGTDALVHSERVQSGKELDDYWYSGQSRGWDYATEDEFNMLNFLANTQGDEAAQSYYEALSKDLTRRRSIEKEEKWDKNYQNAKWYEKAGLNALSVPEKLYGTIFNAIDDVGKLVTGQEYDPYAAYRDIAAHGDNTRKNTALEIDEVTGGGEFLGVSWGDAYQAAMSSIDSVVGAKTFGKGYTVIMGMGAASSKAKQLYDQGASNGQIAAASLFAGTAEMLFEKLSIGYFLDEFVNAPARKWYVNLLKASASGGIEMSEEMATSLSNIITDVMVLGSRSEWKKIITSYKEQGYSDSDAVVNAMWDKGGDILEDGIMGFISGGGMGSVGAVINATNTNKAYKELNTEIQKMTNAVTKPIESYSKEKQSVIGSFLRSVNGELKSFVERVKGGSNKFERFTISNVSERETSDIKNLLGIDVSGYTHNINSDGIKHILNRHGENGEHDSTMSITDDIARVGWVIENYDTVEALTENGGQVYSSGFADKNNNPAPQIRYSKKINGDYYVVEAAFENGYNKLWVQSAYLSNKKEDVTQAAAESENTNHDANARSALASPSSNVTLSQNSQFVNSDITYAREINTDGYIYSGDGKTYIDGESTPVDITGIASIKNGRMTVELSDGRTAELGDVILGGETQAILYEGVLDMGVDAASAQAIVNSYDENAALGALEYVYGMRQAIEYGRIGAKAFLDTGEFTAGLNPKQRELGYEVGRITTENAAKREAQRKQRTTEKDGLPRFARNDDVGKQKNTAEDSGGVKNSIRQTKKIPYLSQLEMIESGNLNGSNSLYIGIPSKQLQSVGISDAPFVMNQGDYRKSRRAFAKNINYSSHSIPYSFFEYLPQYMADAPLLIDNGEKVTIITDYAMNDTKGNDSFVIAGLLKNQAMENDTVNLIKSVYPLDDFVVRITKAAENGKLVVTNKSKAEQMLATIGIQTAEVSRIISLANSSISNYTVNVKRNTVKSRISGGIRFDGITESELDETQKTTVDVFRQLFGGYGITIEFFKSEVDEHGTHTGENGSYDPDTNTIRLDVNAGAQGNDTILFTAAHELTHFIKEWSPEKFKVFSEFLLDSYAKNGQSIDELIEKQKAKAERNGRALDYEAAYEEVVADSCETFLRDSKLFDKLLNLKQQDKSLFEKTKEYISKLFDKVAALRHKYKSFNPDSKEGNVVAKMTDAIEQLHRLWEDAAMTALENSRKASGIQQKNTTEKGGVKFQTRSVNENQVVWIEQNILKENDGLPVHQFIANFIAEHIGEVYTIIESGQKVYIGEDLPSEYTQSKYTQKILRNNPNIVKVKNRASANLGEMIEIATNRRWEKTKHDTNKDAKYGMYRYDTRFGFPILNSKKEVIGANIYTAELVIRNASNGKKYLYDIVGIKKDIVSSDWLSKKTTSAAVKSAGQKNNVSIDSISKSTQKVKDNVKKSERDVGYGDRNNIITTNMTDSQRAKILKNKSINNVAIVKDISADILEKTMDISSWEDINNLFGSKKSTLIQKLASEFGAFKGYSNADINISFEFSKNNFRESYHKQKVNYEQFAKMFSVFDSVVENAIGIEAHNRNTEGYKTDITLNNVYVLMSAFEDGDYIIPVKLEIKEFKDKQNALYVAISLQGIKKAEVSKQGNTENGVTQNSRSAIISITDLFTKINPKDVDFIKYIPNELLTDEQIVAKNKATSAVKHSLRDPAFVSDRELLADAQGNDTILFTAAHELTHFIKEWSPEKFKVFSEFLLDSYAKNGQSIDELIEKQQAKAERNGRALDYEAAYEEVVADSCETFLRDSKLFDKLLNLKEKDLSLFDKTKKYISDLFDKVSGLRHKYKSFNPDSKEGKVVTQMTDAIEQLHTLWEDAAMTALENSHRASGTAQQKNTAENGGGVKLQAREYDANGNAYWRIESEKDVFKGLKTTAQYERAAREFLIKSRDNKTVIHAIDGKEMSFIRLSAEEFTNSEESKELKSNNPEMFNKKMRLIPSLEDLTLNANVNWQSPDLKNHKLFKERGFENFRGKLRIDNVIFNYIVRAGKAKFGDVFYDINLEVDQILPRTNSASGIEKSTSNDSISKSTQKVKDNAKKSDRDVRDSVSKMVGENGKTQKNTADSDSGVRFSERDYPIDAGVAAIVNNSVSAKKVTSHILSTITAEQNKAINRLNNQSKNDLYRGKYTGGKHRFSDTMIKHALKEHGDFLREGLRAQLPITKKDIARHLSAIKDNKSPSTIKPTKTNRGAPSIVTSYEINGYTLYAEEITKSLGKNLPSDLIGHTMYKAPTLATAAALATSARAQPKRQSTVLCSYYMSSKGNLSTANFIADKNGNPALLSYATKNSNPKVDVLLGGLIALSSDKNNFTDMSGDIEKGYVRCRKPFYITQDNKVFSNSETDVAAKLSELKAQGYDCFVFDYNIGDNYMVAVFNDAQIIKDTNGNVTPVYKKTDNTNDKTMHSDRDPAFVSDRELLADALMSAVVNDGEFQILTDYKNNVKQMYMQQQKLDRINMEIKELKQTEPNWYTDSLKKLYEEAKKTRNRINNYDKKLLKLETALMEIQRKEPTLLEQVVQWFKDVINRLRGLPQAESLVDQLDNEINQIESMVRRAYQLRADNDAVALSMQQDNEYDASLCFVRCDDESITGKAEELERQGKSREYIRNKLGVVRDVFGEWKKYLDINKCKLFANATAKTEGHTRKPGFRLDGYSWEGVLSDFVIWDEFFELFPEYENLRVVIRSIPSDYDKVRFNPKAKTVYMDKELCREYINGESKILKSYIMRELQRIIQYEEGRYIGYSIEHWKELEKQGKLPFSEKFNRYLTAEDMMKYFEDNYETELMFKKQEFKHYVSQNRKYNSINDMMMYYPVADAEEVIVYDDDGRLVTLKEKQNKKEKRRFSAGKSGQVELAAEETKLAEQEQSDRQVALGSINAVTENGDNTLKLRSFVASKQKSFVKEQMVRSDYRIKGGNSGFVEKSNTDGEVLDEDYSFMLRSNFASIPIAEHDTVGRYIGINNQEILEDSVCKNEKGEPISLYFMNFYGDNLSQQIGRGLALGTVDMAVAQYDEYKASHKRVQTAICTEVYAVIKRPVCLPFDPHDISYSEICDWLVNQDKITSAQHNRVVTMKSALKPYDYGNYATQVLLDILRDQGYDGIVYKNHRFAEGSKSVIPFYEHQLIPVAYDGILVQDDIIYDDAQDEGANLSITDAAENTENMKRYVIEPKYQNTKKRRLADERIKIGDAGCFEGVETDDAYSAYEKINRELKNNSAKELSGYDTAGHRFTNMAIKNFDGNVFRDADGNILLFSTWNMNPLDIGKAADTGQEFVGFDTALEEFFEHKISTKNSYHGVIEQFAINCVKPLVVRQNGWNTVKMATELSEDGIISQQFYDNIMSLHSTGNGDYMSLASTKLINEIIRKGCDCIVFVKDNGRHSVVPFFAESIIPISQNGILSENSDVVLLSEADMDAAEKANGVVLDPKDRKERDFWELKNKITSIKDKTEKMKRLTESLKYNNAPVWDDVEDVNIGYSGVFERGTVNIWNAKNRFERLIGEQSGIPISNIDTADRRLSGNIQSALANSKLRDKNGRPLSFFIYAKQTQNGFERDTRGYRVSTLAAAHDEYSEISKAQPHRRKQIYNEYLVRAENPYFMMSVPKDFTAREFADSLYGSGVLSEYEYNRILTKSGIDEPSYKGIAAKHINQILQEKGIDSIVYMNGTYDRGSMGVMVFDESQLIPVSQNGVSDENFVENAGENTFDFNDDNDIIKINNRNSYIGRPTAIYTLDVNLNTRQQKILDALPQYDSYLIIRKESISMSDLAALTAKTGVEFAMFTRGSERLIIRGSQRNVNVNLERAKQLAEKGYKFSGHTHPGGDYNCLTASGSDYEILKAFNQKQSVTYNSKGYYMTYEL